MTPEQWHRVKEVFEAALEYAPGERSGFLGQACADDDLLRGEVNSLLSSYEQETGFMETPAGALAAQFLAKEESAALIGQQISHYQIMREIGRGGMGVVYLAEDINLSRRPVALKLLPAHLTTDPDRLRRFEREARAASALNHPNILTIHEIGQRDGRPFIATEFIDGITLREQMRNQELQLTEALNIAAQIASALVAAHKAGIVHRDIKPENVMLRPDGIVKVLDFGLAKLTEPVPPDSVDTEAPTNVKTVPGTVMGTALYMSPEQARGLPVDARTDIFSLGVLVYEMVAGRLPFEGSNVNEVMASILSDKETPPLARYSTEVPAELERIVAKALRKNRDERYQTIKDLLLDLKSLREELEFEAKLEHSARPQRAGGAALRRSDVQAVGTDREPVVQTPAVHAAHNGAGHRYLLGWINRHRRAAALTLTGFSFVLAVLLVFELRPPPPKIGGYTQLTNDGRPKFYNAPIATDGARLYFGETLGTQGFVFQVSVAGGETAQIPISIPGGKPTLLWLRDIAPSKSELLLLSYDIHSKSEGVVWILSVASGALRRLGSILAHEAAWSPDGQQIIYINGPDLYLVRNDGSDPRKLLTAPGPTVYFIRWSPDARRLRFSVFDTEKRVSSLWEVSADGTNLHQLLAGWKTEPGDLIGMGSWTPDGKYYIFVHIRPSTGAANLWALREQDGILAQKNVEPVQLTSGPLSFTQFVPSVDGKKLFARGELRRGELMRYDEKSGHFVSYLSGASAQMLDFSRDGEWVTYVAYPEGTLWRSRVNGSERLQLSFPPQDVAMPRLSPDGKRVSFVARAPGEPLKLYLISAEGGTQEELAPGEHDPSDASWSPDGDKLVFSSLSLPLKASGIRVLDLGTKRVSTLPGSEALEFPRWSPDGRYIAAISVDSHRLMLYDFRTAKWEEAAKGFDSYVSWSRDGKYVYAQARADDPTIIRYRMDNRKIERVAGLKDIGLVTTGPYGQWSGLAPDDSVLVLHNAGTQELYALDWQTP